MPRKRGAMSARRYLRHIRAQVMRSVAKAQRKRLSSRVVSVETILRRTRQPAPLTATMRELRLWGRAPMR